MHQGKVLVLRLCSAWCICWQQASVTVEFLLTWCTALLIPIQGLRFTQLTSCAPFSWVSMCRFLDKEYYVGVHRTSEAMATFKQRLATAPFEVKISGQSYNELNIGFML